MNDILRRQALALLKRFYGYTDFYPLQWEVIDCVMSGKDAVVLMPTGGGKSICYQIPALLSDGCAIVVSPLLSLMKDQVDALLANGVPAAAINSTNNDSVNHEILEQVYAGRIKLLYISPERLLSEMQSWASDMKISLIAIDEAHCISQWGHDFRPEYTQLSVLKDRFPSVPVMALTATADRLTRQDISKQLGIPEAQLFIDSFDRPNIELRVAANVSGKQKLSRIIELIDSSKGGCGIIYCLSRKNVETLTSRLTALGYKAASYHAGLPNDERERVQQEFLNDDIQIVCATIAFGMGINKSNVRWVIHNNMPKNMESYYQEIGRAGRDGLPAVALMFYSFGDVQALMSFAHDSGQSAVNIEKLHRIQQYAESTVCRRRILLNYFNERYDRDCGNCDVCAAPPERIDGTIICQMALSAVIRTGEKVGFTMLIDILRGSRKADLVAAGFDKIKTYGVGHDLSFAAWNAYLLQMLQLGIIDVAYEDSNHIHITPYGREVLVGKSPVQLSKFHYENKFNTQAKQLKESTQLSFDDALFALLKETRYALAKAQHIAPYLIFSDKVLQVIASNRPVSRSEFASLYGIGERKTALYWRQFTSVVINYMNSNK
ncbi:MAG: DNA helicase RecQ [Muribaculaceae bacterium]|jgi:ATP-dependent DNA helicase RecQ|nr:DNA helicase RecQ [Muribaculaceae bacterium]